MSKFNKSQILMLTLLAALLSVTPLLSSSIRPKYLYFIINLLIIALGAEAGLLSAAFSKPLDHHHDKKLHPVSTPQDSSSRPLDHQPACNNEKKKTARVVEKSASEKIVASSSTAMNVEKVKKCASMPSLFFIGSGDTDQDPAVEEHEDEGEAELEEVEGQELFAKAETFIGNFYKQLKMQREESWNRIHGFYQKAF